VQLGNRNQLVACSKKQKFNTEKDSSSKDSEYPNRLLPCSEKPNTGAAASAKKEESRDE
ncbi:hypothetical protein MKX01_010114, partial [Papaver californicum]